MQDLLNIGLFLGAVFVTSFVLAKILKKENPSTWAKRNTIISFVILFTFAVVWYLSV